MIIDLGTSGIGISIAGSMGKRTPDFFLSLSISQRFTYLPSPVVAHGLGFYISLGWDTQTRPFSHRRRWITRMISCIGFHFLEMDEIETGIIPFFFSPIDPCL